MGVDITAYRNLEKIECHFDASGEPIDPTTGDLLDCDGYVQLYKNNDFPGRADEIEDMGCYSFDDDRSCFHASYGGYNRLRDHLAKVAGYPLKKYDTQYGGTNDSYCVDCWNGKTGPFSELIDFSDCEGVIGAKVSSKLAKDFADFQQKADEESDKSFLNFYKCMKAAFEMASDNGAVVFH